MNTLSDVMEKLKSLKLDNEFRYENNSFHAGRGKTYEPEDLTIIKIFRFQVEPNPMELLYIIEANDGLKGYSLDAADEYEPEERIAYQQAMCKIAVHEEENDEVFEP